VRPPLVEKLVRLAVSLAIVAGITVFYRRVLPVNATTVALTYLLAIVAVSTAWGLAIAVVMSIAAMLSFNYNFLPPIGKFTIADPQNWAALVAFLAVSVLVSQLSNRAKRRAEDASLRRREVEKLYLFSQGLLEFGNVIQLQNRIPSQIVEVFEVGAAALLLADKQKVYRSGPVVPALDVESLKANVMREEPYIDAANSLSFMPVRMGMRPIGSIGISGTVLTRQTLEAIGTLTAVAIERARAVEQLGQTEAAREGERLRTALLDAVTHALRTPLTSIKASVTNLLTNPNVSEQQRTELLTIVNEETDRLNRLVGEAAEMAQLDAGEVELNLGPYPIGEVISEAMEQLRTTLAGREVRVNVAPGLPSVRVDLVRARDAVTQLIDNAARYSPVNEPITVTAELGAGGDFVTTSVADRGDGVDEPEHSLIFEKFYRGKEKRFAVQGTGMGLPIAKAIIEAHRGTISVTSQRGHGTVFSFTLPVDRGRPAP
jgi:two-component system, OmpR family, sensor histidine kinase KdpD